MKKIPFGIAIIPIIITVAVMMVTIVVLKQTLTFHLLLVQPLLLLSLGVTVTNGMILKKQCIKGFVLHYPLSSLLFLLA